MWIILLCITYNIWHTYEINPSWYCTLSYDNSIVSLQWRHNEHDGVSNHRGFNCLLNRFFQVPIKKPTKAPRHWPLDFVSSENCGFHVPTTWSFSEYRLQTWWRLKDLDFHNWNYSYHRFIIFKSGYMFSQQAIEIKLVRCILVIIEALGMHDGHHFCQSILWYHIKQFKINKTSLCLQEETAQNLNDHSLAVMYLQ